MGNHSETKLKIHKTDEELLEAIKDMMNSTQNKRFDHYHVHQTLQSIYQSYRKNDFYFRSTQKQTIDVNPVLIHVVFHPKYPQLLHKMIDLFIAEQKFILNKFTKFVEKEDWTFLILVAQFIIIHISPYIRKFSNSLLQNSEISENKKTLAQQICGTKSYLIPNVLAHELSIQKYFNSLVRNTQEIIKMRNGLFGQIARRQPHLGWLICASYILYLQFYFEFGLVQKLVDENFSKHLQLSTYVLAYSIQKQKDIIFDGAILMIQSLITKIQKEIPSISHIYLFGLEKLPVKKSTNIFHQITLLIFSYLTKETKVNKLQALDLLIKLFKKMKVEGDQQILFYLETLCQKINFFDIERVLLQDLIEQYINVNENTTKKIQSYRQAWKKNCNVRTNEGQIIISKSNILDIINQEMKKDNYQKINEKYILYQLGQRILPAAYDKTSIWKQIVEHQLKK